MEGLGSEEDREEYTAENIFYVPRDARWDYIASQATTPEIGHVIDRLWSLSRRRMTD